VGDEQHGEVPPGRGGAEQFDHDGLHGDVQGGGHLVADQQARFGDEGAGDRDPLPLSAGELIGIPGQVAAAEGHVLEHADHPLGLLAAGHPQEPPERLGHDLADRLAGVEGGVRILEDALDLLQDRPRAVPGAGRERGALEGHLAGPVPVQPDDAAGQRRLTRAGLTDHGDARPGRHVQIDAGQDRHRAVIERKSPDRQHGHSRGR
jgi:hypothetical protein